MDEKQIGPGARWQQELQEVIQKASVSMIFLGPHGWGRWQEPEIEACISQNVERRMSVIPVLLPGVPVDFKIPPLLNNFSWADLSKGLFPEELDRLAKVVGIEDVPPLPSSTLRTPRLHNLPFQPLGDLLKGREEELQRLITNLQSPAQATAITQTQAIHGLGGIGKTRLAVEYAWRSGGRYDTALFVAVDSPEALRSGLASLARPSLLKLPEYEAKDEENTIEAVLVWLRDHSRWLLILDNIDTEEAATAVREILSQLVNGHVLLTSRRRAWPPTVQKQPLGELDQEEARQFLFQRTEGERTPAKDDVEQAGRLAEVLGGLPLALEQAGAYIVHHQITFAGYLEDWERERERVLEWHDEAVMDYPASVAATWQKTFQRLSPKAAALLRLTAFLAPEPIPEAMIEKGEAIVDEATKVFRKEARQRASKKAVRDALAELAAYSMVTRSAGNFTVHRVVQEVLQTRVPENSRRGWIEFSLRLVNNYSPFESDDVRTWPVWDVLRPHAARVVEEADRAGILDPTGRLMNQLALLLTEKSLYAQAEPLMRRALAIGEASFGLDHPNVAIRLSNLACLLQVTNRFSESEPLMRRALMIDEASFGLDHPIVATQLNNLAWLLKVTNRFSESEPLMRRVLAIDEASLGPNHPDVARDLNNLAQLLQATNRLTESEPLMRRALMIDEASFGLDHPRVAIQLNNLAKLLQATHRLTESEPLMRRALEIFETSLGPDHPNTQIVRKNLEILIAEMEPDEPA